LGRFLLSNEWAAEKVKLRMSELHGYYQQDRAEMLAFLPAKLERLIDVGCGEGKFGESVKDRFPNCETWGLEPNPEAAAAASLRNDRILNISLSDSTELPSAYFDVVTMNDVLEHMTWPEPALALARRILRPNGKLILSLPNVQYYLNVRDLVFKNDWEYRDCGILDRTHFRFYTTKSAARLLQRNGFEVNQITGINPSNLRLHYKILFRLAPSFFYWMQFPQFAIVATTAKVMSQI
jgi:2-polyprenyl-3-methyl-5-hydroxy-6-metoxy-1,4-benzoquinol methylase